MVVRNESDWSIFLVGSPGKYPVAHCRKNGRQLPHSSHVVYVLEISNFV